MTKENILSAWAKTGIALFNPSIVLNALKLQPLAPAENETTLSNEPKTPHTAKLLRHFKQAFQKNPFKQMLRKLFKSVEQSAAEREIAQFRAAGLKNALEIERKKRQRSKKLNLLGEVPDGGAQWWSGPEIKAAKDYQNQKDAAA